MSVGVEDVSGVPSFVALGISGVVVLGVPSAVDLGFLILLPLGLLVKFSFGFPVKFFRFLWIHVHYNHSDLNRSFNQESTIFLTNLFSLRQIP